MDFKELGITINHVFRYGYGGLLSFLVAAIINPCATEKTIGALGNVLSPLIAFAVGGALYAFYRPVIGELLIFNFFDWIHLKLEPKWGYKKTQNGGEGYTCKCHFLEERFYVLHTNRWNAYRIIRDKLFDAEIGRRFEVQHSEVHLLYLTFIVLLFSSFYLLMKQIFSNEWNQVGLTVMFGVVSLLCFLFGIYADIALCRRECTYLMSLDTDNIRKLLRQVELGK